MHKLALLAAITLFPLLAQENSPDDLADFMNDFHNRNLTGMQVLSGWAVLNIVSGGIGFSRSQGETRYFHQMNAFWNTVNLGIGIYGYYQAQSGLQATYTSLTALDTFHQMQGILLLNAGLDMAYIATGVWLLEKGKNSSDNAARYKGYGRSIILQGAFLLVFDLALYTFHQNSLGSFPGLSAGLSATGTPLLTLELPL